MPDEMNKREVILTIREYENSVAMPEGERVTYLDPRGGVHLKDGEGGHMPDEMNKREVILTIREYENSVAMPEGERVTYLDPRGGVHLKDGDDKASDYTGHAAKCAEYLRFGDEVDAVTCGEYPRSSAVKFCDTPELFVQAGFRPLPMLYTQRHLRDAIRPKSSYDPHRHGLTVEQMKRLPELMEHPVMLCDSPAREDTMLVVLRYVDCDDLPLIMAVRPDGRGYYEAGEIETNFILAVYGRTNFPRYFDNLITPDRVVYYDEERGRTNFPRYFDNLITPDRVVYYDEERGRELNALAKLHLLRSHIVEPDLNATSTTSSRPIGSSIMTKKEAGNSMHLRSYTCFGATSSNPTSIGLLYAARSA